MRPGAPTRARALGASFGAAGAAAVLAAALAGPPAVPRAEAQTSLSSPEVTFSYAKSKYYTGKALKPKVTARYRGKVIDAKYLEVTYSKNTEAGTARITVTGTGKFAGTRKLSFRIYYNMADAKVSVPKHNYRRTGKAVKPKPTVTYRGSKVPAEDYKVSYANNVEGDRAKVTVKGTGDYKGSKSADFKIVGKGGLVIDVSEHDGAINWKKASREIDAAILRAHVTYSLGSHKHKKKGDGKMRADTRYDSYATACEENGVPYGAYAYLVFQGKTEKAVVADAKDQAKRFYKHAFANGHEPLYLVLDLEDSLMNDEGKKICRGAEACAKKLRSLAAKDGRSDLKVGLYCGGDSYDRFGFTTFDGRYIAKNKLDFTWYPAYGKDIGYLPAKKYYPRHANAWDLWQYSSKGKVSGISTDCDVSTSRADGPHKRALSYYQKR